MTVAALDTAVIVRIAIPSRLERLRRRGSSVGGAGVPAHVTLLHPFLPSAALDPSVRADLARIAATTAPFEVRFRRVGRFPDTLYLDPEPARPFRQLTAAIVARWPDHPPYAGRFDEVVPHLTIAEGPAVTTAVAEAAVAALPFVRSVDALEVIAQGVDGRWRRRWRIALRP